MPTPFDLTNTLTYKLHQLAKLIDHHADYDSITGAGISSSEGRIVAVVGCFEPLSVVTLAKYANLDKSQASRAVSSLVTKGLVHKLPDDSDARAYLLSLTESGRQVYAQVTALIAHRHALAVQSLSADEQATLLALMDKIKDNLDGLANLDRG